MYAGWSGFVNRKACFGEQLRRPRLKGRICYFRRPMAEPKITLDEVLHVARLAKLQLSDEEAGQMQAQLDSILEYLAELDALDVSGVEPTFHSISMDAPLRRDVPVPCSDRSEILAEAPETEAGGFAVPLVLEVDS